MHMFYTETATELQVSMLLQSALELCHNTSKLFSMKMIDIKSSVE